jgi:hypothetical protein
LCEAARKHRSSTLPYRTELQAERQECWQVGVLPNSGWRRKRYLVQAQEESLLATVLGGLGEVYSGKALFHFLLYTDWNLVLCACDIIITIKGDLNGNK